MKEQKVKKVKKMQETESRRVSKIAQYLKEHEKGIITNMRAVLK